MPLLTLSTDIGQQDYVVGAIKGQLHAAIENLTIADITHYLPRDNFFQAAYICDNAFKFYPAKTIHLILINVFEATNHHFVLVKVNEQIIICPNNGIITMFNHVQVKSVYTLPIINATTLLQITQQLIQNIALLFKNQPIEKLATKGLSIVEKEVMKPMVGNDWMEGQILFIDNFNNAVINIKQEEFEAERKGRKFKIIFKRTEVIENLSDNYSAVNESEYLAWFNSAGYLELAIHNGDLAELFGLENYNYKMQQRGVVPQNKWFYQTIRIFFE